MLVLPLSAYSYSITTAMNISVNLNCIQHFWVCRMLIYKAFSHCTKWTDSNYLGWHPASWAYPPEWHWHWHWAQLAWGHLDKDWLLKRLFFCTWTRRFPVNIDFLGPACLCQVMRLLGAYCVKRLPPPLQDYLLSVMDCLKQMFPCSCSVPEWISSLL